MKTILLIIPYFGKWPIWFDAYLVSVAANPSVNWLCPTDCDIPEKHPENIRFLPTTLAVLNKHINTVVDTQVPLSPRKLCDLKPAYADIFADEIKEYDFWGFCDMDIIWGDIRKFITDGMLKDYDIISSRKENISGHFNIFRNTKLINTLYKQLPNYKGRFEIPEFQWTDEIVLSNFIKYDPAFKALNLRVYWSRVLCNQENGMDSHQEYYLDRWLWRDGQMLNTKSQEEIMYLHFINWKRTLSHSEIDYLGAMKPFYISYTRMHYKPHSSLIIRFNSLNNVFNGYRVREKRRHNKNKFKSLMKRVKRKLKLD
ncbi:DUF6625 family protein [Bizionia sediminis]|uniref:DUF6625 family protein n=1 Tax=Bizionia sediminis TaxID=1737064 RepID=A0ABW5KS41_9FLAO